jgi:phosphatidylinositol glycan class T
VTGAKGDLFYSTNVLMNMPTPDFSMPYNVITLSCTVIAMLFGSVFNLVVREYEAISK